MSMRHTLFVDTPYVVITILRQVAALRVTRLRDMSCLQRRHYTRGADDATPMLFGIRRCHYAGIIADAR